ncbi:hypothetical protein COV20_05900 [Candidatus Woesearchaeota archaeon CG10_big_fil_rev_8_21_14_0_10_45_16]|nr:MAG: hypothetical protein COV20_05900 [Candidatus Woesearchaeota archaeon CG10_big_fil_rev_8_21_14_0_10_45_16]
MERPKVGLGVFIIKDGKFLLLKRKGAHGEGTWGLAGGHLEFGESYEDCAKRETLEEVGITIQNIRFASVTNDIFENKHYLTIFCTAEYKEGDITNKEPDKCEGIKWFSWDALPQPLFQPIINLIKDGFDLNRSIDRYQHYKGNHYQVLGTARHSETLEEHVIYQGLYDSEFGKDPLWIRPKKDFEEDVTIDGRQVPRFKKI